MLVRTETEVKAGRFSVELTLPPDAEPGPCAVRAFLSGKSACAAGGAEVTVEAK